MRLIDFVLDWAAQHHQLLLWAAGGSLLTFIGTLVLIPVVIIRMPADYFSPERAHGPADVRHVLLRIAGRSLKNLAGLLFVVAGIILFFLPGQGLMTILIGLLLLDFPGKRELERRLIARPLLYRATSRIRHRFGHEPFRL